MVTIAVINMLGLLCYQKIINFFVRNALDIFLNL